MKEEDDISKAYALIHGIRKQKKWITLMGLLGIGFALIFVGSEIWLSTLSEREAKMPIWQTRRYVYALFSIVWIVIGAKLLIFLKKWESRYRILRRAEKEIEQEFLRP